MLRVALPTASRVAGRPANRHSPRPHPVLSTPADLLRQCVVACVASQRYVEKTFFAGHQALGVQEKGIVEHKAGAKDLVTAADVAVQELVVTALTAPQYRDAFVVPGSPRSPHSAPPSRPFDIVGEEDLDLDALTATESATSAWVQKYDPFIRSAMSTTSIAAVDRLLHPMLSNGPALTTEHPLSAPDRYTVYIDPIDSTVAFVDGCRVSPMTLVGIAKNGVPIGGVVSRVFASVDETTNVAGNANPTRKDASMVLPQSLSLCLDGGPVVVWGREVAASNTPKPAQRSGALGKWPIRTTYSSSTRKPLQKALLAALSPVEAHPARGGGNKIMMVAQTQANARAIPDTPPHPLAASQAAREAAPNVDAFASAVGLKKWDTCAPHAFLRCLGGDLYRIATPELTTEERDVTTVDLRPIRYDSDGDAVAPSDNLLLAVTDREVADECARRLLRNRKGLSPTATPATTTTTTTNTTNTVASLPAATTAVSHL